MNVSSIRPAGIPAASPQDRPAVREGVHQDSGAPVRNTIRRAPEDPLPNPAGGVLSEEEQRFFEGLYPAAAAELRTSPTYSRSGIQPDAGTGTILDRRG